jgi:hypothetical protein
MAALPASEAPALDVSQKIFIRILHCTVKLNTLVKWWLGVCGACALVWCGTPMVGGSVADLNWAVEE